MRTDSSVVPKKYGHDFTEQYRFIFFLVDFVEFFELVELVELSILNILTILTLILQQINNGTRRNNILKIDSEVGEISAFERIVSMSNHSFGSFGLTHSHLLPLLHWKHISII